MEARLEVLSRTEQARIHERTLDVLGTVGMRIDTVEGRAILAEHGAMVDEQTGLLRFPPELVEQSIARSTKTFAIGGVRSDWRFDVNAGESTLIASGEAPQVLDRTTGKVRDCTFEDWNEATRLLDAIDDVGVYWQMMSVPENQTTAQRVRYFSDVVRLFGKHVQESFSDPRIAPWLREILQVTIGSTEEIRRRHPLSFLLTPVSPLALERSYTDSWLAMRGLDIPVSILPMPQMGATSPASPLSTVLLANCEALGTLCLVQCADPGVPVIYSAVPIVMDPRSGFWSGVAPYCFLHVATTQMARFYGFPATASACDTDHFFPGVQAGIEKGISALAPMLGGADFLVGPGVLGSATVWSREQVAIDVETFRISRFIRRGISEADDSMTDVIAKVGPGGHFVAESSTRRAMRDGTWFMPELGWHASFVAWQEAGRPSLHEQASEKADELLAGEPSWRLDEAADKALTAICNGAAKAQAAGAVPKV